MTAVYYNTISLSGDELRTAIATAKRQEDAVLAIYRAHGHALSPSDVWAIGAHAGRAWLLTSVRRAITNLSAGERPPLVKTGQVKTSVHRATEHLWARAA